MSDFLSSDAWLSILDAISPFVATTNEKRSVIKTFLPDMLDTGYTGTAALNLFRDSDLGIRTQTFFEIRNEILSDINLTSVLRELPLDQIISENLMRISSYDFGNRHMYVASFALEDSLSNTAIFGENNLITDALLTKSEALSQIVEVIKSKYPAMQLETLTVNLRRAYVNLV